MEIREPFDEEEEKKWKEQRKEKLKESKMKDKKDSEKVKDDEEYWRRLDELEVLIVVTS